MIDDPSTSSVSSSLSSEEMVRFSPACWEYFSEPRLEFVSDRELLSEGERNLSKGQSPEHGQLLAKQSPEHGQFLAKQSPEHGQLPSEQGLGQQDLPLKNKSNSPQEHRQISSSESAQGLSLGRTRDFSQRQECASKPYPSLSELDPAHLPKHIAFIMDGNGRWAKRRGLSRTEGHIAGIDSLRELITSSVRLGIPYVSTYAFSTENWNRPQEEVNSLMGLFAEVIHSEMDLLQAESVKLRFIGSMEELPQETQDSFSEGLELTKNNSNLELALAVNYGSRQEIIHAIKTAIKDVQSHNLNLDELDEDRFSLYLDTSGMPDPDLLIRTSGELRLSNFLLYQLAYTELYASPVLWPDFTRYDLLQALLAYQKRERRFGALVS